MNQNETVKLLQNLLFSENKPEQLRPLDIALLTYLIVRQTEDHFIHDSQLTLANRLGCERKAIADSIKRLDALGWIVSKKSWQWNEKTQRKTRSIGKTVALSVNVAKLPQALDRSKHSGPSPEAVRLAADHTKFLVGLGLSARQHKNFEGQQQHAAQRLIEEMGSYEFALDLLNFSDYDDRHRSAVRKSLYEVRTRLRVIRPAYDAACAERDADAAAAAATVPVAG